MSRQIEIVLASVSTLLAFAACGEDGQSGSTEYEFETGALMMPGEDCDRCHRPGSDYPHAPHWSLGGTVYPSADAEASDGVAGVSVIVSDEAGSPVLTLLTNAAGNFFTSAALPEPYRIALEYEGARIEMPCPPPSGGCAKCHRPAPLGFAPGRIFVPQAQQMAPRPFDCAAWMPR